MEYMANNKEYDEEYYWVGLYEQAEDAHRDIDDDAVRAAVRDALGSGSDNATDTEGIENVWSPEWGYIACISAGEVAEMFVREGRPGAEEAVEWLQAHGITC